jgi:SAM-dependent methyltransferase
MIVQCQLSNPTKTPRIIYDGIVGSQRQIKVMPGTTQSVTLSREVVNRIRSLENDLVVDVKGEAPKSPIVINGMVGIGDCLHQRAGLRELMKKHEVWLRSCHHLMYHDLIEEGLHLVLQTTNLHAQAKTVQRERHLFKPTHVPPGAHVIKMGYGKPEIDRHGSILGTVMARMGVSSDRPDFTMPLRPEWIDKAKSLVDSWNLGGKPLMIYRPVVLRREWNSTTRNPDPAVYDELFRSVRDQYFVVSVADLDPGREWVVGPEADADVKLHKGELDFPTMAALWAEADLVFCNAGFAPVLAQAVGTPSIIVYGGRESFKTTQAAGAHLAPTLGINPDRPCDCHSSSHDCDKRTALAPALEKIKSFIAEHGRRRRVLLLATCYVDSDHRLKLLRHWLSLHRRLNPSCDVLLVDSASPCWGELDLADFTRHEPGKMAKLSWFSFPSNVGHLSRQGRDGWGRAFSFGLDAAVDSGYDYVVHVEGDSLLRRPVEPIIREMARDGVGAASTVVTRKGQQEGGWVETGLMFFSTKFLRESRFPERYNWRARNVAPTPERVVRSLLGSALRLLPLRAVRGNKELVTPENVGELDWVTHCWDRDDIYDRFVSGTKVVHLGQGPDDGEADISKPLGFADASVDYLVCEHRVQRLEQYDAIRFFKECRRVLKPKGVLRIAVPSLEQIAKCEDADYAAMAASNGGPARAILYAWGSRSPWTWTVLEALLFFAGFENVERCSPHTSRHKALCDVEKHHKVIGDKFFEIETIVAEAS